MTAIVAGTCWLCHWGWPKPVADIYREALRRLEGNDCPLQHDAAHVVWADENFHRAQWCLDNFDEYTHLDMTDDEKVIVRWSLEQLAALPESAWDIVPHDYDGVNPQNFPPGEGVEMVPQLEIDGWWKELQPKTVWDRLGELA